MDQHFYVKGVLEFYESEGISIGDPEIGCWCEAHYPEPKGTGDSKILLLWEHHQVQGILQSEEFGRCCFFPGDVVKFLNTSSFIEGWFDLWDLYDKWSSQLGKMASEKSHELKNEEGKSLSSINSHRKKDEFGRSVTAVSNMEKMHAEKDEFGRSVQGVKNAERLHSKKNKDGKSENALKGLKTLHSEKDDKGRSIHAVNTLLKIHDKKDENGKSIVGIESSGRLNSQLWESTIDGFRGKPGPVAWHNKSRGWDPDARIRII
jgi:hypothetical protein